MGIAEIPKRRTRLYQRSAASGSTTAAAAPIVGSGSGIGSTYPQSVSARYPFGDEVMVVIPCSVSYFTQPPPLSHKSYLHFYT